MRADGYKGRIGLFEAVQGRRHDPPADQRRRRRGGDRRPRLPRLRRPSTAAARRWCATASPPPRRRCGSRGTRRRRCLISPISASTRPGASGAGRCAPTARSWRASALDRAQALCRQGRAGGGRRTRRAPLLSRGLLAAQEAQRQAAHPVHPPARDPDPGVAARGGAAHRLAPVGARGGAAHPRQRPRRRGGGPAAVRGDGARGDELPAALPGDGRRRARARAPWRRSWSGSPTCSSGRRRCAARCCRALAYPIVLSRRRRVRRVRADDLRRAQGGRAVPGRGAGAAVADAGGDRPCPASSRAGGGRCCSGWRWRSSCRAGRCGRRISG